MEQLISSEIVTKEIEVLSQDQQFLKKIKNGRIKIINGSNSFYGKQYKGYYGDVRGHNFYNKKIFVSLDIVPNVKLIPFNIEDIEMVTEVSTVENESI